MKQRKRTFQWLGQKQVCEDRKLRTRRAAAFSQTAKSKQAWAAARFASQPTLLNLLMAQAQPTEIFLYFFSVGCSAASVPEIGVPAPRATVPLVLASTA